MNTLVISAFPTMGKTTFFNNRQAKYRMLDSDSSLFSWIKDEHGNHTTERNPNFISDYLTHIKTQAESGEYDIIFVSSHQLVRKALVEYMIPHFLVYPDQALKDRVLTDMQKRGSEAPFISFIENNFDDFITEMDEERLSVWRVGTQVFYMHPVRYIDEEMISYFKHLLNGWNVKRNNHE